MPKISIVIPFYQREAGILSAALNSIKSQHIPSGWFVDVIVVDDGSPRPAEHEIRDLDFQEPLHVRLIVQPNGGVSAARNRGLEEADPATSVIAFLDSDDTWPPNHLSSAIEALESGFDFYFTDNRRVGHHDSCIHSCARETGRVTVTARQKKGIVEIPSDQMVGLIVKEFPCQASTVVYNYKAAGTLRFSTTLQYAGEDVVFFATLAASVQYIGFDPGSSVECGRGVNMCFSNIGANSEKCLLIRVDHILTYSLINRVVKLSSKNKALNEAEIIFYRRELAYHVLRNLVRRPARVPKAVARLVKLEPVAAMMLPFDMIRVAVEQIAYRRAARRKNREDNRGVSEALHVQLASAEPDTHTGHRNGQANNIRA